MIFSSAPKNVEDSGIMAWWEPCILNSVLKIHTAADNYENGKTAAKAVLLACEKRWRGGKMLNNRSEMQGVSERSTSNRTEELEK